MGLNEVMGLEQYSPDEWGAEVDYDNWSKKTGTSQVFVHWTGNAIRDAANEGNKNSEKAVLRSIESGHLRRGWDGAAYDWAIGQSGALYRVRGLGRSAATSGDVDRDGFSNNAEGEAILMMYGKGQEPSPELVKTLYKVLGVIGYDEVYGHKEAGGTATQCPGHEGMKLVRAWNDGSHEVDQPDPDDTQEDEDPSTTTTKTWTEKIMADLGVWEKGDRSRQVRRLQALVNTSGLNSLKEDGIFGPKTEQAVIEYQDHFNLAVDGIVGPETWKHLLLSKY